MMYNEFTERTGFQPTMDEYFATIEPIYTDYDGDKDKFCKEWKKISQEMRDAVNKVVQERIKTIHEYADNINEQNEQLNNLTQEHNTLIDNIGKKECQSQELHNNEMLRLAISTITLVDESAQAALDNHFANVFGKVQWIKVKHSKGLPLTSADIETLINSINL